VKYSSGKVVVQQLFVYLAVYSYWSET